MSHDTSLPPPAPAPAPEAAASPATSSAVGSEVGPVIGPVISASLSVQGLTDDWGHCQQVADYLARFAASDRFDPEQLTTRLSTYLNEVLELVVRGEPAAGELVVTVLRGADRLEVEFAVPALPDGGELLRRVVRAAGEPDVAGAYRRGFAAQIEAGAAGTEAAGAGADIGLLELVALHGIGLGLREAGGGLVLRMIVPHEPHEP